MSVLYISEYSEMAISLMGHVVAAPKEPSVAEQNVAIGVVSAQSSAFSTRTKYILVHTDAVCSIAFGSNPTAVTSAHRLGANESRFYGVDAGDKLAVIANS